MGFHKSLAYEASAGSGKTFALVIRYISLLYLGAKPSSIVSLTFTNKAANEMSERINIVLKELNTPNRISELQEICKTVNLTKDEVLAKRAEIYHTFLQSDLKISTIDKFFSQILRKFSLNLALMPDFKIDQDSDEQKFIDNFLKNVKQKDKYKELISFALLESKKLGSIFTFLDNLYAKDGEIKNIKISKNSNNNEKEILKIAKMIEEIFLSCEKLSPSAKKAIIVDDIDDLLSKSWILKDTLDYHYFKKCFTPRADELFYELKEALKIYFINKDTFLKQNYLELYQIYKDTKREQNITQNTLSFNDVTNCVFELLRENIDSDFLYFRLDAKIDHILIDEFQDTNVIQYKILEPILDEIHAGIGTKEFKTLFYVGDIKQSIYRFRGGAKELFAHTKREYDVTLLALNTNYRSRANIVSFVNESFYTILPHYKDQLSLEQKSGGFVKISTDEELLENIVNNCFLLLKKEIQAQDIAILTYTNSDAYLIEEALLEKDPNLKITTQTSSKLINSPMVSAIIELLKYLYFAEALYKANFLAYIGLSLDETIDISQFNKNQDLLTLVKKIVEHFKLYSDDLALLKFIEIIASYKDIESFLFESEDLAIDSPSKKEEGIKILTIHKSKGLEFEHVIISDRFKKKSADRSSLIFKYEDIELKELFVRLKNRAHFDQQYKEALDAEKELTSFDELNLLYVAFTRAKESLIICQNSENSSFCALNLTDCEIGKIQSQKKPKQPEIVQKLEYKKMKLGLQEQKIKTEKIEKSNFEAQNFGLGLHYMLEIIEEFDEKYIEEAYWAMKNRYELLLDDNLCCEIKKRVTTLINHQPFIKLTSGKILKEQPISFNGELKQLDLLVEHKEYFVIIDYKSSKKRDSNHINQVLHYKSAIQKITDKDVLSYLCYIQEDEIELINI